MKKKILWVVVAIVSLIAVFRVGVFVKGKFFTDVREQEVRIVPVRAAGVVVVDMTESIKLTGDIKGVEVVNLFSQVPGKVKDILISPGQAVSKGQTVMKIDRDVPGMDYMPALVESSISGYAGEIAVDRGESVLPSMPLVQVVNMKKVEAVVSIIEGDVNRVRLGMRALIKVDAFPGRVFEGRVYKKSAVLDAASRTQEARVLILNDALLLRHGMFADVEIVISKMKNVPALPVDAVLRDENGNAFVYCVENGRAKRKGVAIGIADNDFAEIKSGVSADAVVVTLGKENVSDGEYLKVYMDDEYGAGKK